MLVAGIQRRSPDNKKALLLMDLVHLLLFANEFCFVFNSVDDWVSFFSPTASEASRSPTPVSVEAPQPVVLASFISHAFTHILAPLSSCIVLFLGWHHHSAQYELAIDRERTTQIKFEDPTWVDKLSFR